MKITIRRFSVARIMEHAVQVMIIGVLVITGLVQRLYTLEFSQWFILKAGGIDAVRLIHRYAGIVFSCAVLAHILAAIHGLVVGRWQPSMVITKRDFLNAVHNIKYYLGNEQYPAKGSRYSHTQKFEYWGILTGGLIMISTGAVLWKPMLMTRFLTGEIIPAAKVLHSNEALVVFLIISFWHIYNAIFSPEVFPLNRSIFTGFLSRERMIHEHILELAAMEGRTPEEIRAHQQEEGDRESMPDPDR